LELGGELLNEEIAGAALLSVNDGVKIQANYIGKRAGQPGTPSFIDVEVILLTDIRH
jgi:hypothetical protein